MESPGRVDFSACTLQLMQKSAGERSVHPDSDALCTRNGFEFFDALRFEGGINCKVARGTWVLVDHQKVEMGLLATHPAVPDPCSCIYRVESIFQDAADAESREMRCNFACTYYPEDPELVDALKVQSVGAELGDVVPANNRIVLPAGRIIGLADVGGSHGAPLMLHALFDHCVDGP